MTTRLVTVPEFSEPQNKTGPKWGDETYLGQESYAVVQNIFDLESQKVVFKGVGEIKEFLCFCKSWILVRQSEDGNSLDSYCIVNPATEEVVDLPAYEYSFFPTAFGFDVNDENRPEDIIFFCFDINTRMFQCRLLYNDSIWLQLQVGGVEDLPTNVDNYMRPKNVLVDSENRSIWFTCDQCVCVFKYPKVDDGPVSYDVPLRFVCDDAPLSLVRLHKDIYVVTLDYLRRCFKVLKLEANFELQKLHSEPIVMEQQHWDLFIASGRSGYALLGEGTSSSKLYIANFLKDNPHWELDAECACYDFSTGETSVLVKCLSVHGCAYQHPGSYWECRCHSAWIHGNE
nr:uncharacterized protein LOC113696981 [Coffea arabica]